MNSYIKRRSVFQRKLIEPIANVLKTGVSPKKIAMSMAFGLGLGIFPFPLFGISSLLCFIAVFTFRLNIIAVQAVSLILYPLQILLFIPFIHLGAVIFKSQTIGMTADELIHLLETDFRSAMVHVGGAVIRGMAAWGILVIPIILTSYGFFVLFTKRVMRSSTFLQRSEVSSAR